MAKYIIDAYGWIEYLDGTPAGRKVKDIVYNESNEVYTSAISLSEVVSKIGRLGKGPRMGFEAITTYSKIYPVGYELAYQAGLEHAKMRKIIKNFGLGDAFILATSKLLNAKIVTGDEHFRNIKNVLMIK